MKLVAKFGLLAAAVLMSAAPASAGLFFYNAPTSAPEIDGPAGIAAIAVLTSLGLMAYDRMKR